MKCRVCRGTAVIDLPRHNANFCAEHLVQFCHRQVEKAISDHSMIEPGDRLLLAVSGGKDSLALWAILDSLGYDVDGLHVGLGIGDYSDLAAHHTRLFADARGLALTEVDLRDHYGYDIPTAAEASARKPCSACGLSKRHVFDSAATEGGYDALVTGHNLDDEAAVLLGNLLRWNTDYLGRQSPVLEAGAGLPRKVKPLIRLSERETAAYCLVSGIEYQVDECPMAEGNRHIGLKETLNELEVATPGVKANFYLSFLDRGLALFEPQARSERAGLTSCASCGAASTSSTCAFCRLVERVNQTPEGAT